MRNSLLLCKAHLAITGIYLKKKKKKLKLHHRKKKLCTFVLQYIFTKTENKGAQNITNF